MLIQPSAPRANGIAPLPSQPVAAAVDQFELGTYPALTVPTLPSRPRRFWKEAVQCGFMSAAGTVGGTISVPLAQQLIGVITDLQSAGLRFMGGDWQRADRPRWQRDAMGKAGEDYVKYMESERQWARDHELRAEDVAAELLKAQPKLHVDGVDMGDTRIPVTSLSDLHALDALYVTHDLTGLPNAPLAHALDHMGNLGLMFFKPLDAGHPSEGMYAFNNHGDSQRPVGKYGALMLIEGRVPATSDPLAGTPVLVGFSEPPLAPKESWKWRYTYPLESADDAIGASYFHFHGTDESLDTNPLAQQLRQVIQEGYTFENTPMTTLASKAPIYIGVGNVGLEKTSIDKLDQLSPQTREIRQLFSETLKPMVDDHRMQSRDVAWFMRACLPPGPLPTLRDRWMLLFELLMARGNQQSPIESYENPLEDYLFLQALPNPGSADWRAREVPRYVECMHETKTPQEAQTKFTAEKVVEAVGDADGATAKAFVTALLAGDCAGMDQACKLGSDATQAHLGVIRDMFATRSQLTVPTYPEPKLGRGEETLRDYITVRATAQPFETAASQLQSLQKMLSPYESWDTCRDTFRFLQANRFHGRSYEQSTHDLMTAYIEDHDLEAAQKSLSQPHTTCSEGWSWENDSVLFKGLALSLARTPGVDDDIGHFHARRLIGPLKRMLSSAPPEQQPTARDFALALALNNASGVNEAWQRASGELHDFLGTLVGLFNTHTTITAHGYDDGAGLETMKDYETVAAHQPPSPTIDGAAQRLQVVQSFLAAREGWDACRQTFSLVQDGLRDDKLHGRTFDEALTDLLNPYLVGKDLEHSRETMLQGPPPAPGAQERITRDDDVVSLGGIKVKVRKDR